MNAYYGHGITRTMTTTAVAAVVLRAIHLQRRCAPTNANHNPTLVRGRLMTDGIIFRYCWARNTKTKMKIYHPIECNNRFAFNFDLIVLCVLAGRACRTVLLPYRRSHPIHIHRPAKFSVQGESGEWARHVYKKQQSNCACARVPSWGTTISNQTEHRRPKYFGASNRRVGGQAANGYRADAEELRRRSWRI